MSERSSRWSLSWRSIMARTRGAVAASFWVLGAALFLCAPDGVWAQARTTPPTDAAWARLLESAAQGSQVSYQAIMQRRWGSLDRQMHIEHFVVDGQAYQRQWPIGKAVETRPDAGVRQIAGLGLNPNDIVRSQGSYEWQWMAGTRVGGQPVQAWTAKARDGHRYTRRFWFHETNGLLIKEEWIAPDGEVLASRELVQLQWAGLQVPAWVSAARDRKEEKDEQLERQRQRQRRGEPVQAPRHEAAWQNPLPGFVLVQSLRRARGERIQLIYSDGLAHLSVFIEPRREQDRLAAQALRRGMTHSVTIDRGPMRLTAVGELPLEAIQTVMSRLENLSEELNVKRRSP